MFELMLFLTVFIVGGTMMGTGLVGAVVAYERAGRFNGEARLLAGVSITGLIMVVLVLIYSPFKVVMP